MLGKILVLLCLVQATLSVHPDGTFVDCDCPDVEMDPNLQLDERTACDKPNTRAAEISVGEVNGHVVATSLNMDLGDLLDEFSVREQDKPLVIVADTVRIKQTIKLSQPQVSIYARHIRVAKHRLILTERNTLFLALADKVSGSSLNVNGLEYDPLKSLSSCNFGRDIIERALVQLTDQFEYTLRTSQTLNERHGVCNAHAGTTKDRDDLDQHFDWALKTMQICGAQEQKTRLALLRKYRGPILEGDLFTLLGAKTYPDLTKMLKSKVEEVAENRMKVVTRMTSQWDSLRHSIGNLKWKAKTVDNVETVLKITDGLFNGDFSSLHNQELQQDWVKRLGLVQKATSAMKMWHEIGNPDMIDDTYILETPHDQWPKEFDFFELKNTIATLSRNLEEQQDLAIIKQWTVLIKDFETLYHLRNLDAGLQLQIWFDHLASQGFVTYHRQYVLQDFPYYKRSSKELTRTTSVVTLSSVPSHLLASGLVEKQIWPSNQDFNELAHMRVEDIRVEIPSLENSPDHFTVKTDNILFHDLDEQGQRLAYTGFPTFFPPSEKANPTSPFNRWTIVPTTGLAKDFLNKQQSVHVKLVFSLTGFLTPGLTGKTSDCPTDNTEAFTECKYEGQVPFYGMCDIVTAMSLPEINNLLRQKYENQLNNGVDEGVTTVVNTPWSGNIGPMGCTHVPTVGDYNITRYVKMSANLGAPWIHFPQNLEGYIKLQYSLENSVLYGSDISYECKPDGQLLGNVTTEYELSGHLTVIVPLAMTNGGVDGDEDGDGVVYLYFHDSAINVQNFSYDNPLGLGHLLEATKVEFIRTFTQTELSRIKYDPKVTPEYVRPDKFVFLTFCEGCDGTPEDDGYLITMIKTRSANSLWIGHPTDPEVLGLNHACPDEYNAVVYLASHITMCDIYFHSFQEADTDLTFAVKKHTPNGVMILQIEYLTDFCVAFTVPELVEHSVTVHIYTKSFRFRPHNTNVTTHLDNTNSAHDIGDLIQKVLSGEVIDCGDNCEHWWDWLNPFSGCLSLFNIVCWILGEIFNKDDVWEKGSLHAYKDTLTKYNFEPECLQFKFPNMTFNPEVEFIFDGVPTSQDEEAILDASKRIALAMKNILSFRLSESDSISLFAAVNLLFPGAKIIEADQRSFYSPGPIVMYGNIRKEYLPCEDIALPEVCGRTLEC